MRLRHAWLLLCVLGTALPCWKFVPWLMEHGLNFSLFYHELFATLVVGVSLGLPLFLYLRQRELDNAAFPLR